jgi:dihydropteroate synthase
VLTGRSVQDRLAGSVAAALASAAGGARILRVHDVAATVDALKVWHALRPAVNQCGDNGKEQGAFQP